MGPLLFINDYKVQRFGEKRREFVWRLLAERLKSQGVPQTFKQKGSQ